MSTLKFKFKWVNEQGHETTIMSRKGELTNDLLILEKQEIPAWSIYQLIQRDQVVFLGYTLSNENHAECWISIQSNKAHELVTRVNQIRSQRFLKAHQAITNALATPTVSRSAECPYCQSQIILTGLEPTSQTYCIYCDTVFDSSAQGRPIIPERDYTLCPECHMFSRVQRYTEFYFYFLFVVYGFHHQPHWCCAGCMRKRAWRMFFGNLLFVLGVPVACVQLFRSYKNSWFDRWYRGLDRANYYARRKQLERAVSDYRNILKLQPVNAGLKFNIAQALVALEQPEQALCASELALRDCANYLPAYNLLLHCYHELDEAETPAALEWTELMPVMNPVLHSWLIWNLNLVDSTPSVEATDLFSSSAHDVNPFAPPKYE